MIFRIGSRRYALRRRWSLRCQGDDLDGLCDSSSYTIWLDGQLAPEAIMETLRHEHTHAWQFQVGRPSTHEDEAAFVATVSEAFDQEFQEQGGLEALLAIPIEGIRPGDADRRSRTPRPQISDRVKCGRCGAWVMNGSIDTSPAREDQAAGIWLVDRGCQCGVCNAVMVWAELATPEGLPLSRYFQVRILEEWEAGRWVRAHPKGRGVYNVP